MDAPPPTPWDGYLDGPENALAHASVLALARGEPSAPSPLVLHGPSGVGKSRLLAGLVAEVLARRPGASVARLEATEFAARCREAADTPGGWAEVRAAFRHVDLFIIEDVQVLDRSPYALDELAHTLDALDAAGASVAASARGAPARWEGWPDRLVSRFLGGLAVGVDRPGVESRRRYVLDQSRRRGVRLSAEAVDALADRADGYRGIDGLLARLGLESRGEVAPLPSERVGAIADEDPSTGSPTVERIVAEVAAAYGLKPRDLRSASRRAALVAPRHLAMLLARERSGLSFAAIGSYLGGRDPASVRHGCKAAAGRLAGDAAMAGVAEGLRRGWRVGILGFEGAGS